MKEPLEKRTILKNPENQDEYEILGKLSEGGFGITYTAMESKAGGNGTFQTKVCIKELYPKDFEHLLKREDDLLVFNGLAKNEEKEELLKEWKVFEDQFLAEATTLFRLKERNNKLAVPKARAIFKRNDLSCYLVMDFVEGRSLYDCMKKKKKKKTVYSVEEAMRCLQAVVEVLKEMHCLRFIHEDIHPGNILIGNAGKGYLIDFGNVTESDDYGKTKTRPLSCTRSGLQIRRAEIPLGYHPVYAPYEFTGQMGPWGTFSDVASLAGILYVMLTNSEKTLGKYNRGYVKKIDPIRKYNRSVPREVDRVIIKALSRDYEARYQTVEEFWTDLQEAYFHKWRFIAKNIFPKTSNRVVQKRIKNDQTEFIEIRKATVQGDASTQLRLGNCYYNGQGVEQSDVLRKIGEHNHTVLFKR